MQEFLIAPAASRAMWFLLLVPGVVICLVVGLLGSALLGARGARFEVSPQPASAARATAAIRKGRSLITGPSGRSRRAGHRR